MKELQRVLQRTGIDSGNLIIGIDFTSSNDWCGRKSFKGLSLHRVNERVINPYQEALLVIEKTLPDNSSKSLSCYGFGCATTRDQSVFNFATDDNPCRSIKDIMRSYRQITKHVILSGPTSFAPIIRRAVEIVHANKAFCVLFIIADGQVTNENETVEAIVEASKYPLSIIVIGVGDGPWDSMSKFTLTLPKRQFENFFFVEMNTTVSAAHESGKDHSDELALEVTYLSSLTFSIFRNNILLCQIFPSSFLRIFLRKSNLFAL